MNRLAAFALTVTIAVTLAARGDSREVGSVGVDWTGNDIAIDALADPQVDGVICHTAYFNRSFIDRVSQGNWFEGPSYSELDCSVAGPLPLARFRPEAVARRSSRKGVR